MEILCGGALDKALEGPVKTLDKKNLDDNL